MVGELIQIYYDDAQLAELYTFARPHKNETLDIFFENSIIADLILNTSSEKIAICSWRLREKMNWQLKRPRELTQEIIDGDDYQVLSFTNNSQHHKMLAAAEIWHPGFRETMMLLLECIKKEMPFYVRDAIYQNHFAARREIYSDYVVGWLIPAMSAIMSVPELHERAMKNSNYADRGRKPPEYLVEKIGVPYYPIAPFLLERLFSIYCSSNNIPISWL